jgi:hypothetical protein
MQYNIPYKKDLCGAQGHKRTTSMFAEFDDLLGPGKDHLKTIFTFSKEPAEGLVSFSNVYLASSTEYEACMQLLGDWEHWKALLASPRIMEYLTPLREEKQQMEELKILNILKELAANGNVAAVTKLHAIITKKDVGRPAEKENKKKEAHNAKVTSLVNRLSKG